VARCTQRVVWFRDGQVIHENLKPEELGREQGIVSLQQEQA
jgi:putative ABC transport system ATP-binding protein